MDASYRAPAITDLGSVARLTLANVDGENTDGLFPNNTPKGELTFS